MKAPVRRKFRQAGDYMLPGNNPARQCDEALCRVRDGDMTGLETIYNMLGRRIYMLALSVLKDTESAKDVMQETFVRLVLENVLPMFSSGSLMVSCPIFVFKPF